jgi:hypothetical protein
MVRIQAGQAFAIALKTKMNGFCAVACFAAAIASPSCYAVGSADCLSAFDVSSIKRDFFTDFGSKTTFDKFVDPANFELLTNAADGAMLRRAGRPASEKIVWITGMFRDHKPLFADMSGLDRPIFSYVKGELQGKEPSVDNGRATTKFPKNECVLEVTYRATGQRCVMSQELSNLSLTFIKDAHKLKLASVEMFFATCSEK